MVQIIHCYLFVIAGLLLYIAALKYSIDVGKAILDRRVITAIFLFLRAECLIVIAWVVVGLRNTV